MCKGNSQHVVAALCQYITIVCRAPAGTFFVCSFVIFWCTCTVAWSMACASKVGWVLVCVDQLWRLVTVVKASQHVGCCAQPPLCLLLAPLTNASELCRG